MKQLFIFLVFAITASSCTLAPCLTKEAFISSSNSAFEVFNDNQDSYSKKDWLAMDDQFENFLNNCYPKYESEMSNEELKKFWLSTSQYFIKRGYKGPEMKESLKDLYGKHLEDYLKKMGSKFSNQFESLLNINIDNAVDKLFDFLDDLEIDVENK